MGTLPDKQELKCVFLHNFSNREISLILRAVKTVFKQENEDSDEAIKKLIFARTTATSLTMQVEEWIEDVSGDHLHLLENPPTTPSDTLA